MAQAYSNPDRATDEFALPDIETFQLTATEVAAGLDDECFEFMKRHEFRLAGMNGRIREAMLDAMIDELGIEGGWFYWYCFPGCLPDSEPVGPFKTEREALEEAQSNNE